MKKKVLVTDETDSILKIISLILSNEYDLVLKNKGMDAVNWLEAGNRPQLIISDIRFPGYLGESLIYFLKYNNNISDIPVILTSISDDLDAKLSSMPFEVNGSLKKPFNATDLRSVVKRVINMVNTN